MQNQGYFSYNQVLLTNPNVDCKMSLFNKVNEIVIVDIFKVLVLNDTMSNVTLISML